MKKHILLLAFACFSLQLFGQDVQVTEDPKIAQLYKNWVSNNRTNSRIDGWRVQLMASTDRAQVEDARNRFRTGYPDVSAEWVLEKPYYKLRVGAFRNKLETLAFISELIGWPGAFPTKDSNIHPRDFLEQ